MLLLDEQEGTNPNFYFDRSVAGSVLLLFGWTTEEGSWVFLDR